jgi:hypothetical protein
MPSVRFLISHFRSDPHADARAKLAAVSTTVIFAGAGASKAINANEYPTADEFFRRLPPEIKQDTVFDLAANYLLLNVTKGEGPDVEQLLWVLRELDTFLRAASDVHGVAGWMLNKVWFARQFGVTSDTAELPKHAAELREHVSQIIGTINACVYEFYATLPADHELEPNWLALLRPLLSSDVPVELFTTNYDLNIEATLEILYGSANPPKQQIGTGRGAGLYRVLTEYLWARKPEHKLPEPAGLLTKLHGSVDWSRGREGILVGDPLFKGAHERHVILYPGFKGAPTEKPFTLFHDYFAGALSSASFILFIGFAFRDEYINDLLQRFTSTHAKILVIDPAPQLSRVPFAEGRVMHLSKPFNLESVSLALNTISLSQTSRAGA